jgi:uncharacterized protein YggE
MAETPTISVRSVGRATLPPDRTVITFELEALKTDYLDSINDLNARVETLRDRLEKAGFARSDLKTTDFGVKAHHDFRGEGNKRELTFIGWKAGHDLRLVLPVDRDRLNKALVAITGGGIQSEIGVSFEVSDRHALRAMLLEDATRTAARHADVMARAAGCTLGRPIRIDYGWNEVRVSTRRHELRAGLVADDAMMLAPDIEPDDVRAEDSVTVVFELER